MVQDVLVRLPLPMLDTVQIFRVRGEVIARAEMREVALDVARGAAAAGGGEADVGGHGCGEKI